MSTIANDAVDSFMIEPSPPEFSDEALALEFASKHADDLRYVAAWGQWFVWDGLRWKQDVTLRARDFARGHCRDVSARCHNQGNIAKLIAGAPTISAVERLAMADRRLAATVDQWDRDPWLLNTPTGTIDLRTGGMREHSREDYSTKMTAVAPGGECPRWRTFLEQCTRGDQELAAFLARVGGLSLTGITRDHALFFLYGQGGNGKGVYTRTLCDVLLDYATSAPIETFIASNSDRHPTELARLRGARLVIASEPERDRHWNESRIKLLTGEDRIAARFMRQDLFEFDPQFKLVISANDRPRFRGVNNAMRRRLHLIPFNVTIPKDQQDKSLANKLREEWAGILAWMIAGCLEWQKIGIAPPRAVREATESYLEDEDTFGQWIGACCAPRTNTWTATKDLHAAWSQFAAELGEEPGSVKLFAQQFEARGFQPKRIASGRGFGDVLLKR